MTRPALCLLVFLHGLTAEAIQDYLREAAFTGGPDRSKWTETPAWLKPVGDGAFCAGINRLVLHTCPLQPWGEDIRPGMTMGQWGTHFGRTQTWWDSGRAWLAYLARYCENPQAFQVAAKMSDYFAARLAKLKPDQIEAMFRTDYTGNPVNEFGGMAEALTDLYLLARNQGDAKADRHLKLAALFNRDWLIDPLLQGQDQLSGLHGNTHIAQACGLARYALAARDDRTGQAAEVFWKLVVQKHSFVNGGNSFHEILRAPGIEVTGTGNSALSPLTAEFCNTHNMLKLTRSFFERAPAVACADYYELALYNHILASIAPDHGKVIYYVPLRPGDFRVHIDSPFCCLGTGIENAARFGEAIYFHRGNALWVNLFIPSTLDWREQGMKIRLDSLYPEDGKIRLTLETSQSVEATLDFRTPAWLVGLAGVKVNGIKMPAQPSPGTFLPLTRTWKNGDTIDLLLLLKLPVRPSTDDPATLSFFYGPVLLAGKLGRAAMPASDIGDNMAHSGDPAWPVPAFESVTPLKPVPDIKPDANVPMTFTARMVNPVDLQPVPVTLAPLYQVHHQRCAVYWKVPTPPQLKARFQAHRGAQAGGVFDIRLEPLAK